MLDVRKPVGDVGDAGDLSTSTDKVAIWRTVFGLRLSALGDFFAKAWASPALTGVPTAPTAAHDNNTAQVATTAHVKSVSVDDLTAPRADVAWNAKKITGLADPTNPQDAATKAYTDQIIAAQDAMVFKGVIDCSVNPNYPAADRGWTYRVSIAGKIGGGTGVNVEAGDLLVCLTDGTASGTQAAAGAAWTISQANIDGAVVGPASSIDNRVAVFDGATGKLIKDGGVALGTAAALDVGVLANKIVQLDAAAKLPAVDGSQLINMAAGGGAVRYDAVQAITAAQKDQARKNIGGGGAGGYSALASSRNSATPNTKIDINAVAIDLFDSGFNAYRAINVAQYLDCTTTGAGGLISGALANSTEYYTFLIYNPTTDALAAFACPVATGLNPTLPGGYVYKRRIGWFVTDGSAHIVDYRQVGDLFTYGVPRTFAGGAASWAAVSTAGMVPPTVISTRAVLIHNNNEVGLGDAVGNKLIYLYSASSAAQNFSAEAGAYPAVGRYLYYTSSNGAGIANITGWRDNI